MIQYPQMLRILRIAGHSLTRLQRWLDTLKSCRSSWSDVVQYPYFDIVHVWHPVKTILLFQDGGDVCEAEDPVARQQPRRETERDRRVYIIVFIIQIYKYFFYG